MNVCVVIPTLGRPSLRRLIESLGPVHHQVGAAVLVVDDRRCASGNLDVPPFVEVIRGRSVGPAAARNDGWRASKADWICFLDDDVIATPDWAERLTADLQSAASAVAGVQGKIRVPLPAERRPTDWERNVWGLQDAHWATADMAYRRAALARIGGFDERFPRAYREDADLALRAMDAGYTLTQGRRVVEHPVPPAGFWVSVSRQAGNRDDALMRALHGRDWRSRAGAPPGRLRRHAIFTASGIFALLFAASGRHSAAALAAGVYGLGTAEFTASRIGPGPRCRQEVIRMAVTSVVIPPWAVANAAYGEFRAAALARRRELPLKPLAVLLDRDGTLIDDVPYNGDPRLVRSLPKAESALSRLRAAGVATAVVTNQSGIGRGLLTESEVAAVNRRVEQLLGPLGPWFVCPHEPDDECLCRKPSPGLVLAASRALGIPPERCALIGDTGADVHAALRAGARPVLVPNEMTRKEEIAMAPEVADDIGAAVDVLLGGGQ